MNEQRPSKELAYRDALARIRQICRSNLRDFVAAATAAGEAYDIANRTLDAHGDLFVTAHEPTTPLRMQIEYQPQGRCLWHLDCNISPSGIMREIKREESRSLLECGHCNLRGYYPVGAVGPVCVDVVPHTAEPPPAARKPDKFDLAFEIMRQLEDEDMETMQSCQFGYVMRVTREGHSCGHVEFRPIATAPKDGSTILLRCPKGIVEGCWEQVDGGGHPENGPPVYWWTSPFTEFIDGPYDAPTHWALIPRDASTKPACNCEGPQKIGPGYHAPYCATMAGTEFAKRYAPPETNGERDE